MNIRESTSIYGAQIQAYRKQIGDVQQQRKKLENKIKNTSGGKEKYAGEAASLELTYNMLMEKLNEYQDYMEKVNEKKNVIKEGVDTKNQAKAVEEEFENLGKILTVVRRMIKGDIVPSFDEKKVMEYDDKLYQMAKNAQMMAQMQKEKLKKHKSLWEDEEPLEMEDGDEVADNSQAPMGAPEIAEVSDIEINIGE